MRNALSSAVLKLFGFGGYFVILIMGYRLICGGVISFPDVVYCFQVRSSLAKGIFMFIACLNNIRASAVCAERINVVLEE